MNPLIVSVYNEQQDLPFADSLEKQVHAIVENILKLEEAQYHEFSCYFVDTPRICELHADFFDDPTPTDCISFPMDMDEEEDSKHRILGDVFVCPATAIQYVKNEGGDPYEETTLYVVHGVLHLLGYDDIDEEDEPAMRAAEKRHMTALKEKNLILR